MYTYAFLRQSYSDLSLPEGIYGGLRLVSEAGISAVVEPEVDVEALKQNDQQLIQAVVSHDRIIQDLFNQTAVLPLRFGTQFISLEKLLEHLSANAASYLSKLIALEGKAEYTLKLIPQEFSEPLAPVNKTGREYFLAKKQHYQSQLEQQQQQQTELQNLRDSLVTLRAHSTPITHFISDAACDDIERIYILAPRQAEAQLLRNLETLQGQCPHWSFSCSEALPPYHFVQ